MTGWKVSEPANVERLPIVVKVEKLPRVNRPQSGLCLADVV